MARPPAARRLQRDGTPYPRRGGRSATESSRGEARSHLFHVQALARAILSGQAARERRLQDETQLLRQLADEPGDRSFALLPACKALGNLLCAGRTRQAKAKRVSRGAAKKRSRSELAAARRGAVSKDARQGGKREEVVPTNEERARGRRRRWGSKNLEHDRRGHPPEPLALSPRGRRPIPPKDRRPTHRNAHRPP